jgi:hypothetical protein
MGLIVNVPGGSEVQFQIRKRAMVKILTDNLATKRRVCQYHQHLITAFL